MLHLKNHVAFDFETDSRDPRDARIITAGIVFFHGDVEIPGPDRGRYLVKPERPIPEETTAIHGITTEEAARNGIARRTAVLGITQTLAHALRNGPVTAYNARYDFTVLDRECRRLGLPTLSDVMPDGAVEPVVDPLILDKQVDRYRRGSRSLEAVCKHYRVDLTAAHTAHADAKAAGLLAVAITQKHFPDADPMGLHMCQQEWAEDQGRNLQKYFDSLPAYNDRAGETVELAWPVIPEDA